MARGSETALRGVRPGDAPALAALSAQLGYPASPDAVALRLERILERPDEVVLVAVGPQGAVIGWAHAAEQRFLESEAGCELLGLVVDRARRRAGIGRLLVAAVEEWAAGRGLGRMSVRSNATRSESHPFYERLGYERVKTQHVYRKPLTPGTAARRPTRR